MAEKPDTPKLENPITEQGEPEVYIDIAGVEHSRPVTQDSPQDSHQERRVDKEASEPPQDLPEELKSTSAD